MQSKEHLLFHVLVTQHRLHYSDRKFFTNLSVLVKNSKITTGQAALFDKLVVKYYSQLKNNTRPLEELLALPWQVEVIETSRNYTAARVTLVDNKIVLQIPLNRKFVSKFDFLPNNPFVWNSSNKQYTAPLSTFALKTIYNILPSYFAEVRYSDNLQKLINTATSIGKDLIWQPTYMKVNDSYLVSATNETLDNLYKDICFDDTSETLYKLSKLGITIDSKIINNDPYRRFAAEQVTSVEITDLNRLVSWCKQLGITEVLLGKGVHDVFERTREFFKEFLEALNKNNIKYKPFKHSGYEKDATQTELPALIQYHVNESAKFYGSNAIGKCILVTNSTPIEV